MCATLLSMEPLLSNIMAVYAAARPEHIDEGKAWYQTQQELVTSFDPEGNVERACAITAVLSANTSWSANLTLVEKVYDQRHGYGVGFKDKVDKVNRILDGESPSSVVSGPKVTAFYSTLVSPHSSYAIPVIDRHAYDIAVGEPLGNAHRPISKEKGYEKIARLYRWAANIAAIGAPELQAITWLVWKEANGILV